MSSGNLSQEHADKPQSSPNQGRRRLVKAGLGTAPVIMTLTSRSAFAWHCKSPSGFVSGNNSHAATPDEGTLSPLTWVGLADWPAPFNKKSGKWPAFYGTAFDGHKFSSGVINYQHGGTAVNVHDVMQSGIAAGSGANALGAYILAALLNLKKGLVPDVCLTEAVLFKMFNDCATQGYYVPMNSNTTVHWNAQAVIDYLRQNWLVG